eukprot:CAMPEP_0203657410 /NCGR_PEP_ID=MMETSP0088-20131115/44760_1 /ASSEMBLY_ACC=CAM_ASM_001087 /TAXON_ID=426623 /ORGANISM="Chaetoceros affinis, Strain CCMP159" /LENGTH=99 /DNA_ID=CAMNT_0050518707 /DNA_START=355 /DNA_END=654 /DNA_ORIENTATION=-
MDVSEHFQAEVSSLDPSSTILRSNPVHLVVHQEETEDPPLIFSYTLLGGPLPQKVDYPPRIRKGVHPNSKHRPFHRVHDLRPSLGGDNQVFHITYSFAM